MTEFSTGKRVLITGGGVGIGASIVRALAASGFDILFTYHSSTDEAAALADELSGSTPGIRIDNQQVDLTDKGAVEAFVSEFVEDQLFYGLVHNAGNSYDSLAALVNQDRAEELMQLNFWVLTRLVSACVRPMMRVKEGRIVGIGSVTAAHGVTGNAVYAATKGAMNSYIKTLAIEVARKQVCANYIAPGFVDTRLLEPYAEQRAEVEKNIPLQRYAQPEEIAGLVNYLLSPLGGYITGSVIPIDGGLNASLAVRR